MSHNSFGHLFRVTTFGESHGVALGAVVHPAFYGLAAFVGAGLLTAGVTMVQPWPPS